MARILGRRSIAGWVLAFLSAVMLSVIAYRDASSGSSIDVDLTSNQILPLQIDAVTLQQLQQPSKDFQLSLIEYNKLSFTDYDRLAHIFMQCVVDTGASFSENRLLASNSYFFVIYSPAGNAGAINPALAACSEKYYDPLIPAWSLAHQPSRDTILEANTALATCLRENGFDMPETNPMRADFRRLYGASGHPDDRFLACAGNVSEQFGFGALFLGG